MRFKALIPVWIKRPIKQFLARRGYLDRESDSYATVLIKPFGTMACTTVNGGRRWTRKTRLVAIGAPHGDDGINRP